MGLFRAFPGLPWECAEAGAGMSPEATSLCPPAMGWLATGHPAETAFIKDTGCRPSFCSVPLKMRTWLVDCTENGALDQLTHAERAHDPLLSLLWLWRHVAPVPGRCSSSHCKRKESGLRLLLRGQYPHSRWSLGKWNRRIQRTEIEELTQNRH